MLKSLKEIFNITNKYIVLATPLILFSLISSVYIAFTAGGRLVNLFIGMLLFFLMLGAFIAGWFNMIKTAVSEPEMENTNSLIKEFPAGVGDYFLSSLGAVLTAGALFAIITSAGFFIGVKTIGNPGIPQESFSKALENASALKTFLASLTAQQLYQINLWNILLLCTMSLTYFLLLLYFPAMFFKTKNPLKAFFVSLKDLFSRKFFKTLGIYILIFILNFFISIFTALFSGNIPVGFIITLINFYCAVFIGVGVFYYYFNNFVRPQIRQNIDMEV